MISSTVLLGLLCFLSFSKAANQNALITNLPGFNGTFPSKHYSGYVNIDESHGKNLFYYFIASERNPSKDLLFYGSMVDLGVLASMASCMSTVLVSLN
ncbi:hypothetical protein IFM89_012843 [Coptis chinensis]|uniref:Uncharacterized protein n=1 Tax=Coptis chinensis TaxID=261450 RepID=A0A835IW74_9MAGN|nr:hypothetical protein IFM89_012843 [Coptis chinensis]